MIADQGYILNQYTISPNNGFLPNKPPILRLPPLYYQPWESILDRLPDLINAHLVRTTTNGIPILDTSKLSSEDEWRRAYVVLSFITHAYIWEGPEPSQSLPPSICCPYHEVAEHFGLPSTATYAAFNLWNWAPRYSEADLTSPENIRMLHTFTGTSDEEWFYLISIAIEAEGAKIIPTMLECFEAVQADNTVKTVQLLNKIDACIVRLGKILDRMHERCDPYIFYHRIRPFLAGSKGMATAGLPNGIFYDEAAGRGTWRQYSGGSNAQSSLIQLLDIMLGVEHYATDTTMSASKKTAAKAKQGYIEEMRRYMPGQHKQFLYHIADIANIRPYALRCDIGSAVRKAYTEAVQSLTTFRDKHILIVARYIIAPSRQALTSKDNTRMDIATISMQHSGDNTSDRAQLCGTGGTHLMPFLKQTRDETKQAGVIQDLVVASVGNLPGSRANLSVVI